MTLLLWFSISFTGQQVIDNFHGRFIDEMDTTSVVHSLYHKDIISNAVLQQVTATSDWRNQNEILYTHLKRTCTKDSLITTCHKIIAVTGNPRMKALGEDMLSMLEGENDTRVSLNACSSVCTCDLKLNTRSLD